VSLAALRLVTPAFEEPNMKPLTDDDFTEDDFVAFVTLAEQVVVKARREVELQEWLARLEPSCHTCVRGGIRYICPGGQRRMHDVAPCPTFEEIPEVAREREIAAAAFECQTAEVH
jgi:hypothetical protein